MAFSPGLMWHLKDYGIFRKPQCGDFGGDRAESDPVTESQCTVYVHWKKSATKSSRSVKPFLDYALP